MAPGSRRDDPARPVLVVDLGAQYAQLIARRVREAHVYSEIVPHDATAAELARRRPAGLILSGGPASVYEVGAPSVDPGLFDLGVPVLGICYGHQLMARDLGGEVAATGQREYGGTAMSVDRPGGVLLQHLLQLVLIRPDVTAGKLLLLLPIQGHGSGARVRVG